MGSDQKTRSRQQYFSAVFYQTHKDCEINWSVWPFQTKGYKVIKENSNCNASEKTVPGLFEMERERGGGRGKKENKDLNLNSKEQRILDNNFDISEEIIVSKSLFHKKITS